MFKILESGLWGEFYSKEKLYTYQKAHIIINGDVTKSLEIQKGTRQGCLLSLLLFILVLEVLIGDIRLKIKKRDLHTEGFWLGFARTSEWY